MKCREPYEVRDVKIELSTHLTSSSHDPGQPYKLGLPLVNVGYNLISIGYDTHIHHLTPPDRTSTSLDRDRVQILNNAIS